MSSYGYDELTYFDAQCGDYWQGDEQANPLDLQVVGEPAWIVGSPDGWKLAPMKLDGRRVELLRPSSIVGFVFVWDERQQRERQVHESCLRTESRK